MKMLPKPQEEADPVPQTLSRGIFDREAAVAREEADGHMKELQGLKESLMKLNADMKVLRVQMYAHVNEIEELKGKEKVQEEKERRHHEETEGLRAQIKGHVEEIVELRELSKLSKAELEKVTGLLKRFEEELGAERAKSSAASGEAGQAKGGMGAPDTAEELDALRRDLSRTQTDIEEVRLTTYTM